ncbi:MAG TPA: shikimate kinase [Acidimicrobiales bacterium]|nr:shikimate kinase [Acidimicrobiales bacterium]
MTERILLIGMMGAGKTTVGKKLAARLGWRHFDSDAQVQARTGRTVPDIFAEQGEAAFRQEEALALAEAVGLDEPVVVSVAGGAVLDPANRRLLSRSGSVIWLRADPGTLAARVGTGDGRPLLENDPAASLARLDAVRRPLYEELADHTVDVDPLSADQTAEDIYQWWSGMQTGRRPA